MRADPAAERDDDRAHAERAVPARPVLGLPRSSPPADPLQPPRGPRPHRLLPHAGGPEVPPLHRGPAPGAEEPPPAQSVPLAADGLAPVRTSDAGRGPTSALTCAHHVGARGPDHPAGWGDRD